MNENKPQPPAARGRGSQINPANRFARLSYEDDLEHLEYDLEAQEGQRAVAVHALENLAHSDTGIVMLRRMLREQIKAVEDGRDPVNVVRNSAANRRIPTGAWNTVLSPAEAAATPYSETL